MPSEVMRDRYYSNIRSKLSFLVTEIRLDNSVNLQALNIHAENIFAGVLNILYGWSLKNANAEQQNAAGIDLFDADKKIVVQVSSKHTHKKIQEESIDKIVKQTVGDGDSAPRYAGYHYYFLAIAEIARPTKAFTVPDWLTFDPKKDILDLTRLLSDVLNFGPEKQKELSDFLDREMSSEAATQRMRTVAENTPLSERNPFHYDAETITFVGRESEMDQLYAFLGGNDPFKWWAIVGPGGSGKSRLAYELKNELLENGEWYAEFLGENAYHEMDALSNDQLNEKYPGKTLLIADYVQQHSGELGRWMNRLSSGDLRRDKPIRLLLLERSVGDGSFPWETQIYGVARRAKPIKDKKHDDFMILKPFSKETDTLLTLVLSFAETIRTREPELPTLGESEAKEIIRKLNQIDTGLLRPLFAVFVTDAFLHRPDAPGWDRTELLDYVAERENDLLNGAIQSLSANGEPNESLFTACMFIWCVATALGPAGNPKESEIINLCKDEWSIIIESAKYYHIASAEKLLYRLGLLEREHILSLRPDLLGEYYVLKWLNSEDTQQEDISRFFSLILQYDEISKIFLQRVLTDYAPLLQQNPTLLDFLLPQKVKLSDQHVHVLIDSLRGLCFGREQEFGNLLAFASDKKQFSWWAVVGPSGVGKSQLVYRVTEELKLTNDWQIINWDCGLGLSELKRCISETARDNHNTFIILDSTDMYFPEIGVFLRERSEEQSFDGKERVLLLLRDDQKYHGEYLWEKELYGDDRRIALIGRKYSDPLILYPIEDHEMETIIRLHSIALCISDHNLKPLSNEETYYILTALKAQNKAVYSPLYALLFSDIMVHQHFPLDAPITDFISVLCLSFDSQIRKNVSYFLPQECDNLEWFESSCFFLFRIIVCTGQIGRVDWVMLSEACADLWEKLCAFGHRYEIAPEALMNKILPIGSSSLSYFHVALEENYLLRWIMDKNPEDEDVKAFLQVVLLMPDSFSFFNNSINHNKIYGDDLSIAMALLPGEPFWEEEKIARYIHLLRRLFEESRYHLIRQLIVSRANRNMERLSGVSTTIATAVGDVAAILYNSGNTNSAYDLLKRVLVIMQSLYGEDSYETASVYTNLANVAHEIHDYSSAIDYCCQAISILEKVDGANSLSVAAVYNTYGAVYQSLGLFPLAIQYFDKAAKNRESFLGKSHPLTAIVYNNLGSSYKDIGLKSQAISFYKDALDAFENSYGDLHPITATVNANVAELYKRDKKYPEALIRYQKSYRSREVILGAHDIETITTGFEIAEVFYENLRDYSNAKKWYEKVVESSNGYLEESHPIVKRAETALILIKLLFDR